jgi:hypothetical protein
MCGLNYSTKLPVTNFPMGQILTGIIIYYMLYLSSNKKYDLSNEFMYKDFLFKSSTPCIIRNPNTNNTYMILNRCNHNFNYKMVNQLLVIDNEFNILKNKIIDYDFTDKLFCDGFEDMRLFVHNDTIYYIGVHRKFNSYTLVSDIFRTSTCFKQKFTVNKINITFPTDYKIEKNWVFFTYKNHLRVIYRWYPLQICEIDYNSRQLNLLNETPMPDLFKYIFGSSCGVFYHQCYWFIVHKHIKRNYSHMFVVFDKDMNLMKYSEFFKFETDREFSYGFLIEKDDFIITYSTNNSTSKVAVFSYDYIENDIQWNHQVKV